MNKTFLCKLRGSHCGFPAGTVMTVVSQSSKPTGYEMKKNLPSIGVKEKDLSAMSYLGYWDFTEI